ncbi:protein kinase, partial [candidate division CSSED10-310 bacterium]
MPLNKQSESIGPYRIVQPLGQGGMGVVYRAEHRQTGQIAALKTVRVVHHNVIQSIRREIRALARMDHPGIVRIFEEGVERGYPWYAMELLEGLPLRRYIRKPLQIPDSSLHEAQTQDVIQEKRISEQKPQESFSGTWWTQNLSRVENKKETARPSAEPGSRASIPGKTSKRKVSQGVIQQQSLLLILTLIQRLCSPLAYLHGEGIVHRDLKPDNVLVKPDGTPVLVDFGLVTEFGGKASRETLSIEGFSLGTASYMAPEQIRGEYVDPRADLYALGCMLYELLSGQTPFRGGSIPEIMYAHLKQKPASLSSLIINIPPQLDKLVQALLAKDPQDRLGYADDVSAVLTELGAENGIAVHGPKPRSYLYRSGLVDREEYLGQLHRFLIELNNGHGALVLLGGESGVGKTRLVMEFAREIIDQDYSVLSGECLERSPQPLALFRKALQTIADRCRIKGSQETDRLLGPHGPVLAQFEPALSGLPGQDQFSSPLRLPSRDARHRLFNSLFATL